MFGECMGQSQTSAGGRCWHQEPLGLGVERLSSWLYLQGKGRRDCWERAEVGTGCREYFRGSMEKRPPAPSTHSYTHKGWPGTISNLGKALVAVHGLCHLILTVVPPPRCGCHCPITAGRSQGRGRSAQGHPGRVCQSRNCNRVSAAKRPC